MEYLYNISKEIGDKKERISRASGMVEEKVKRILYTMVMVRSRIQMGDEEYKEAVEKDFEGAFTSWEREFKLLVNIFKSLTNKDMGTKWLEDGWLNYDRTQVGDDVRESDDIIKGTSSLIEVEGLDIAYTLAEIGDSVSYISKDEELWEKYNGLTRIEKGRFNFLVALYEILNGKNMGEKWLEIEYNNFVSIQK